MYLRRNEKSVSVEYYDACKKGIINNNKRFFLNFSVVFVFFSVIYLFQTCIRWREVVVVEI